MPALSRANLRNFNLLPYLMYNKMVEIETIGQMQGQIFKIHSDFYYVNTAEGVFECKIRDVLKKQKAQIYTGDFAELESINPDSKQAFISKILERKNFIPKPKVANIDKIVVVSAIKEPSLDFEQLNRYLCFCEYYGIKPALCFNKNDLKDDSTVIEEIKKIYEPLGYEIIFTSAKEKEGIEELEGILADKITVFCGLSGVGKSSLANAINPALNLRTKEVSTKTDRGTHTTRHCEIVELELSSGKRAKLVDTPGFSHLRFDFLMPAEISVLFPEINRFKEGCKFSDCLHEHETGCNVLANLDKIAKSRYESYLQFTKEAKDYKTQVTYGGKKTESRSKFLHNKTVTKISDKKRQISRKTANQKTEKEHRNE